VDWGWSGSEEIGRVIKGCELSSSGGGLVVFTDVGRRRLEGNKRTFLRGGHELENSGK
jgi:hypothetical protein